MSVIKVLLHADGTRTVDSAENDERFAPTHILARSPDLRGPGYRKTFELVQVQPFKRVGAEMLVAVFRETKHEEPR